MPLYERVGKKPDIGLEKLGTYKSGEKKKGRVWKMVILRYFLQSKVKEKEKENEIFMVFFCLPDVSCVAETAFVPFCS